MRIQFCGADRTVTGSCHLIEINGLRLLLDCGLYQGPREEARRINQYLPDEIRSDDAVLLTHGHLDHCGKLPVLTRAGYRGPIHCTPATAEIARIVLEDSGEIQEEYAAYFNRRLRRENQAAMEPLYRRRDIPDVLERLSPIRYRTRTALGKGVFFTFHNAGHILGSACILLEWKEEGENRTLLFTGDVGRYDAPIIRDPDPLPGPVDHLITESTYGNRMHAPMAEVGPQLLEAVRECIGRGGRLLVPAFAVGRTQTILWYMEKFIAEGAIEPLPIFVDSPMGVEVSRITRDFRDNYDDQTLELIGRKDLFGLARVTFASSTHESRQINSRKGPCIIIASSATCEFGRILHHLKRSVEDPNDMVLFVGWTPPRTLGRRLQDGVRRVKVMDRWYEVRCAIRTLHGLSAHADGDELLRFMKPAIGPQTTAYVVHGEEEQAEAFAGRLLRAGAGAAMIPAMESSVVKYAVPRSQPGERRGEDVVRE